MVSTISFLAIAAYHGAPRKRGMNHITIEYIVFPDEREALVINQRVYLRVQGEGWEPIDPDTLNQIALSRNARVQGIVIQGVSR